MRYTVNINEFKGNIRKLKDSFKDGKEINKELLRLGKLFASAAAGNANKEFDVGDSGGGLGQLVDVTKKAFNVVVTTGKRVTLIYPYEKILDESLQTTVSIHNPRTYPSYWRFVRYGFGLKARPLNVIGIAAQRYVSRIGKTSSRQNGGYLLGYRAPFLVGNLISPFHPEIEFMAMGGVFSKARFWNITPVYHPGFRGFDWFDQSKAGEKKRFDHVARRIDIITQRAIDKHFKKNARTKRKKRR